MYHNITPWNTYYKYDPIMRTKRWQVAAPAITKYMARPLILIPVLMQNFRNPILWTMINARPQHDYVQKKKYKNNKFYHISHYYIHMRWLYDRTLAVCDPRCKATISVQQLRQNTKVITGRAMPTKLPSQVHFRVANILATSWKLWTHVRIGANLGLVNLKKKICQKYRAR